MEYLGNNRKPIFAFNLVKKLGVVVFSGLVICAVLEGCFVLLFDNHFFVTDKTLTFTTTTTRPMLNLSSEVQSDTQLVFETATAQLSCPATELCYGLDGKGTLAVSNNQGKNWQTLIAALSSSLKLEETGSNLANWKISCPDKATCFITTASKKAPYFAYYISTKDAGLTWTTQVRSSYGDIDTVRGLSCATILFCVVVTHELQITTDGGKSWVQKSISNARFFNDVACVDAKNCFVVGGVRGIEMSEGYLFSTTDGGKTWAKKANTAPLYKIKCSDKTHCVAQSDRGIFFQITDGVVRRQVS